MIRINYLGDEFYLDASTSMPTRNSLLSVDELYQKLARITGNQVFDLDLFFLPPLTASPSCGDDVRTGAGGAANEGGTRGGPVNVKALLSSRRANGSTPIEQLLMLSSGSDDGTPSLVQNTAMEFTLRKKQLHVGIGTGDDDNISSSSIIINKKKKNGKHHRRGSSMITNFVVHHPHPKKGSSAKQGGQKDTNGLSSSSVDVAGGRDDDNDDDDNDQDPAMSYLRMTDEERDSLNLKSRSMVIESLHRRCEKLDGSDDDEGFLKSSKLIFDISSYRTLSMFLDWLYKDIQAKLSTTNQIKDMKVWIPDDCFIALLTWNQLTTSTGSKSRGSSGRSRGNNSNNIHDIVQKLQDLHVNALSYIAAGCTDPKKPTTIKTNQNTNPKKTAFVLRISHAGCGYIPWYRQGQEVDDENSDSEGNGEDTSGTNPASCQCQIPLEDSSYREGGSLMFYNPNKKKIQEVPRYVGTLTIHKPTVLHAVTSLTRGVRKSLFVLDEDCVLAEQQLQSNQLDRNSVDTDGDDDDVRNDNFFSIASATTTTSSHFVTVKKSMIEQYYEDSKNLKQHIEVHQRQLTLEPDVLTTSQLQMLFQTNDTVAG